MGGVGNDFVDGQQGQRPGVAGRGRRCLPVGSGDGNDTDVEGQGGFMPRSPSTAPT